MPSHPQQADFKDGYGRLLNARNPNYQLPADEPEMERLTVQHRMLKLGLGSLYWPCEEVKKQLAPEAGVQKRVLDIGTGSGVWAVEMAMEFPHVQVLGVDLIPPAVTSIPPNCQFEIADVAKEDLVERFGTFDVVHCRCLGAGFRTGYKAFFLGVAANVSPGGILCDVDGDLEFLDEFKQPLKPAYEGQPGSWFMRFATEWIARDPQIDSDWVPAQKLTPVWLRSDKRLSDIRVSEIHCAMGWNGAEDNLCHNREEVGRLAAQNGIAVTQAFRPILLSIGVSAEEFDCWAAKAEKEILETRVKMYLRYHLIFARRNE